VESFAKPKISSQFLRVNEVLKFVKIHITAPNLVIY